MAYENKTIDSVYKLLINSFQEKFNNSLRLLPKAFIKILCKVLAGIFILPYKLVGWWYLQLFPDTAYYGTVKILGFTINPLIKLGEQFGVKEPTSGQAWSGTVRLNVVSEGRAIMTGTQFKSDATGLVYVSGETVTAEGETVDIPIYCTQSGTAGNLSEGDSIKLVSPLGFVEQEGSVQSVTQIGVDDETEEHYRARVNTRYALQPQGGAASDYRIWAYDVPGVLQTYPYNDEESPGGVIIYVAGTTDVYPTRIPGRELCVAVGEACTYDPQTGIASRKPLTAIIDPDADGTYRNIKPVSVVTVDVFITNIVGVDKADFGASYKSALKNFLLEREPYIRGLSDDNNKKNLITTNNLIAIANSIATSYKAKFGTVQMQVNSVTMTDYTLKKNELADLGTIYIDGEEYEE